MSMWVGFAMQNLFCKPRKIWTVENEFISPVIKKSWILKMVYGKHLLYFSDF